VHEHAETVDRGRAVFARDAQERRLAWVVDEIDADLPGTQCIPRNRQIRRVRRAADVVHRRRHPDWSGVDDEGATLGDGTAFVPRGRLTIREARSNSRGRGLARTHRHSSAGPPERERDGTRRAAAAEHECGHARRVVARFAE
jgi:hypothetical protein